MNKFFKTTTVALFIVVSMWSLASAEEMQVKEAIAIYIIGNGNFLHIVISASERYSMSMNFYEATIFEKTDEAYKVSLHKKGTPWDTSGSRRFIVSLTRFMEMTLEGVRPKWVIPRG